MLEQETIVLNLATICLVNIFVPMPQRNESTNTGAQVQIPTYSTSANNIQMHESDNTTDSSAVSHSVRGDLQWQVNLK